MPEIKNQFTGGKMNKDLDERLVPKGEYRDAMNIQVSTSEGSDVGTIQNILGNKEIGFQDGFVLPAGSITVGCIADEKNDTLYYLVWSDSVNYIISYTKNNPYGLPVFVDYNNVLEFQNNTYITGINIIDNMLLWTDNKTEPKKINIIRCKAGTTNFTQHTRLINNTQLVNLATAIDIETKHITVIKKAPKTSLKLKLNTSRDPNKIYTGVITLVKGPNLQTNISKEDHPFSVDGSRNESSFIGRIGISGPITNFRYDFNGITTEDGSNIFSVRIAEGVDSAGAIVPLGPINAPDGWGTNPVGSSPGLQGWHHSGATYGDSFSNGDGQFKRTNIPVGTKVVLKPFDNDGASIPGLPITDYVIKGEIVDRWNVDEDNPNYIPGSNDATTSGQSVDIKVTAIDGFPPVVDDDQIELKYVIDLFDDNEKLFEFKFPRFSYRYKYSDGEYSTFAPWTQVAFQPGSFDYHPRKGYNLGMTNRIINVDLFGLVTEKTPKDVTSVDILFKDEPSPNVYVVDTIQKNDYALPGAQNTWNSILLTGSGYAGGGYYRIEKETINAVVPSNQMLRPWDNVPKKALAQDITGNRIIYGNYVQNYNLNVLDGGKYIPKFLVDFVEFPGSLLSNTLGQAINTRLSGAGKSIKSLREYQLGVVFTDKYGRETPVMSNESGTIKLEKKRADKYNRLNVALGGDHPDYINGLQYFKFYVKETAGEYYNMAMDRWYDAEDGNIWLAFPSSDRNKIDIDSFLILKKGSDISDLVVDPAKYKVISIENEAPDFIKTKRVLSASITHGSLRDIFGDTIDQGPAQGRNQFELNYKAFFGTAAMHLDNYTDGELWIEFIKGGTGQASDRYKISSVEHDHDKDDGNGAIGLNGAKYYFSLEDDLGADINFITNDPTGVNSTKISAGTQVNIYKYEVKNSPKFDGRFFVKIYSDDIFSDNIGKSYLEGLDYRILNSKKVYYMHPDHRKMHTIDVNDFLTFGEFTEFNEPDIITDYGLVSYSDLPFLKWGYYAVREFTSMALFFRRYGQRELKAELKNNQQALPNVYMRDRLLPHLKPGDNDSGSGQLQPIGVGSNLFEYEGSGEYTSTWSPAKKWIEEHGYSGSPLPMDLTGLPNTEPGSSSNWGYTANHRRSQQGGSPNAYLREDYNIKADNARDTEVWFIDGGPFAGSCFSDDNGLNFSETDRWESRRFGPEGTIFSNAFIGGSQPAVIGGANDYVDFYAGIHDGVVSNINNDTHSMNIGFGGIAMPSVTTSSLGTVDNFFNLGNWDQGGGTLNKQYTDLEPFIKNLNSGVKFRWKQDPTGQTYTIGSATRKNTIRHSSTRGGEGPGYPNLIERTNNDDIMESNRATSMAEQLSFNFSKNWRTAGITPSYVDRWNPLQDGEISASDGGAVIHLVCCDASGSTSAGGLTAIGDDIQSDLQIYVTSLVGDSDNHLTLPSGGDGDTYNQSTLMVGMALSRYTPAGGIEASVISHLLGTEEYLVIRRVDTETDGSIFWYKLTLGGYKKPFKNEEHALASNSNKQPEVGSNFKFVQVGMNGYSHNSEFNINTMAKNHPGNSGNDAYGAITAVGFDLEFIEYIEPEEILSENPAIWETEPKTEEGLNIYYEASASIPMQITADTIEAAFPINSTIFAGGIMGIYKLDVVGYLDNQLMVKDRWGVANTAQTYTDVGVGNVTCLRPDGIDFTPSITAVADTFFPTTTLDLHGLLTIDPFLYNLSYNLDSHNCYSFGNGVESNRIRDNFNLPFIANGVKVSTTLEEDYKEEHRKYGLIYSGIYNSTSGLNNLNQFIQAEKITKDLNPAYGSIQKLKAGWGQAGDLIALCEDRILKILANKDALFNADGNSNVTATNKVLGTATPYSGEYGISTNPESFASEAYRAYFSDRVRGRVMRLSMDGLTPISDYGMKDWFKDNLKISNTVVGSYDDKKDEYNITLKRNPHALPISIIANVTSIVEEAIVGFSLEPEVISGSGDSGGVFGPGGSVAESDPGDAVVDDSDNNMGI